MSTHTLQVITLRDVGGRFSFSPCWKQTFLNPTLPWLCASLRLKPKWLARDNIDRRSGLSPEDFVREYEGPNRPVVITDVVTKWPAMQKWTPEYLLELCGDTAFEAGPVDMRLGDFLKYSEGCEEEKPLYLFDRKSFDKVPALAADYEEKSLYLFNRKSFDKVPALAADYEVPPYFTADLFSVLGDKRPDFRWLIVGPDRSGSNFHLGLTKLVSPNGLFSVLGDKRPDFRWLIVGSDRSGSNFHVDPNRSTVGPDRSGSNFYVDPNRLVNARVTGHADAEANCPSTGAWNAVVTGRKKWILFPPHVPPPGVEPSEDGSEVQAPVSIAEWFLNYYPSTRDGKVKPVECVCEAGELIYVPHGSGFISENEF
ncbi:hypothetical protein T484DRAFT_1820114 [Baffinella frigidus]|nr:hypothetical protein T484DRAFT_1820114 [Cryptophyta sp. CCMP2293]